MLPSRRPLYSIDICIGRMSQLKGAVADCLPDHWIEVARGAQAPTLYEQVYIQRDGHAMILLHLERPADDEEEQKRRELQQSWQPRFRRR